MKTKIVAGLIILVIIIAGGSYYLSKRGVADASTQGWQVYSNPTIGLSLRYPPDWKFKALDEDPITHGDIIKDGKIYTSFVAGFSGPGDSHISLGHGPLASPSLVSYDDESVAEQLQVVACQKDYASDCRQITNKNGVVYVRSEGCDQDQGCSLDISVPTGKYIVGFNTEANDLTSLNKTATILDQMAATLKLE